MVQSDLSAGDQGYMVEVLSEIPGVIAWLLVRWSLILGLPLLIA